MVLMLAVGPVIVWVGGVQVRQERAQRDAQSTAQHSRQTYQPALVQVHDYRSSPNDASVIVIRQSALDFRRVPGHVGGDRRTDGLPGWWGYDGLLPSHTLTGTYTGPLHNLLATYKRIGVSGLSMKRLVENKVVEGWNSFDGLTEWQQLGLLDSLKLPNTLSIQGGFRKTGTSEVSQVALLLVFRAQAGERVERAIPYGSLRTRFYDR